MPTTLEQPATISLVYAAFDEASHRVYRTAMAGSRGGVDQADRRWLFECSRLETAGDPIVIASNAVLHDEVLESIQRRLNAERAE